MSFPAGKHDDQVDALGLIGQVLDRMNKGTAPKPEEPIRGLLGLTGLTMDEAWELARPKRPDWGCPDLKKEPRGPVDPAATARSYSVYSNAKAAHVAWANRYRNAMSALRAFIPQFQT